MTSRNDPCWCGSGIKWKKCHFPLRSPEDKQALTKEYLKKYGIVIKTQQQIEGIKRACKLTASILDALCKKAAAGVTTNELDILAAQLHKEAGAIAAPLGYCSPPYPKSICTSLNEVICHGIPDDNPLKEGDILNIDVSTFIGGYFGDCSRMVAIGPISEEKKLVMDVSYECLMRSIAILKPNVLVLDIGNTIETYARSQGCSVVDEFIGHGIGLKFHEPPQIPHHYNELNIPLAEGMTFTIEPMINAGVRSAIIDESNHWTARTADGRASAQWEHTVLITKDGYEILTPWTRNT